MTVYVDKARIPATVNRIRGRWSHLTADTRDELDAFALRLGLRPAWFQTCKTRCSREGEPCPHWHYDVTDPVRERAISYGAELVDLRGMGAIIAARRAAYRNTTTITEESR